MLWLGFSWQNEGVGTEEGFLPCFLPEWMRLVAKPGIVLSLAFLRNKVLLGEGPMSRFSPFLTFFACLLLLQ